MIRWNLILSGRVQHVGLRFRAKMTAQQYGLTGWVRNLDDGNVELEVQGEQQNIYRFLNTLGNLPGIQFTIIYSEKLEPKTEKRFGVR